MKKELAFLLLIVSVVLISCKKEIYGCTNIEASNYSAVATKDDGSCFITQPAVKSTIVTISNWTQNGNDWVTIIPYGEISSDVIDNGAVVVYKESGTNVWSSLPLTIYQSIDYSTTIEVSITVGQAIIYWKNSDSSLPSNPGENTYKIAVVS